MVPRSDETSKRPSTPAGQEKRALITRRDVVLAVSTGLLASPLIAGGESRGEVQRPKPRFSFLVGPYPSLGLFEYRLDCRDLCKAQPSAVGWKLLIERNGRPLKSEIHPLAADGQAHGYVDVGAMPDQAVYVLHAIIVNKSQQELARQRESFTRRVMAFERAPVAGESDILVPPFTAPVVDGLEVSCYGRTYRHGRDALLEQITAAGRSLFSRPAVLRAQVGSHPLTVLKGGAVELKAGGTGGVAYRQSFSGDGLTLHVRGEFDYDGFYRFTVRMAPTHRAVEVKDLRLEIGFKETVAELIEAAVTWRRILGPQKECMGELDKKQGWLWDSKTFPSRNWFRIGNMPPYFWLGDNDRGLVYSCASEEGMHNDENLAAATLERRGAEVIYTAWFVNSPLHLTAERIFEFALQASPFKAMPVHGRLWRNQGHRQPYKNGILFTDWFTNGSYPTYGRFLTLPLLKKYAQASGADQAGPMASAVSECGGTPEYLQFWHEWGSGLGWNKQKPPPPPDWAVKMMEEAHLPVNPFIRVESASNVGVSNVRYRAWWYEQEARHADISYIYQDNPPYVYYFDPPNGYGYIRDDGRKETSSAIWNSRDFMKRIAVTAIEAGKTTSPYIWANAISPVLPGRSFCRKMLNGEYLYTKLFTLGQIRVMASKQWGMVLDWYPFPQTPESPYPNIGPVRQYWREVFSRLLLHDITNFSGSDDDAGYCDCWLNALDVFWLDDPSVHWHAYYRNDTEPRSAEKTTYISTYTAQGRVLLFISNQRAAAVVETVHPGYLEKFTHDAPAYFYDAETGEEIERGADGTLRLFIPGMDYRVVVGFVARWKFAAANAIGMPGLPAQSTRDPEETLTAISKRLLDFPTMVDVPGGDELYVQWMKKVMAALPADSADVVYYDAKACSGVDFGQPGIQCSMFYNKRCDALLVNYYNSSRQPVALSAKVREVLAKKAGKTSYNYIIHPVYGISEWQFIDIPARRGLLEIYYPDDPDYYGPRRGPFNVGTMVGNIRNAVDANQRSLGGRPLT
jgi:hypothetical protein